MKNILRLAANEGDTILANAADGGSPFAILQGDGFVVPYGDFPHKLGMQKFDRAAADAMVAAHNSALNRLARHFGGGTYPVYVGHPDLPGSKDADKRAYGWIENMRAGEDGLHLAVKWSDAGRELIENAHFKFYSPLWWTRKIKGGIQPIGLKSMGLTNDPNIPVPALANEAAADDDDLQPDNQPTTDTMNPDILAALGLEEGATPEEVLAKITELKAAADAANADNSELETAKAEAETLKAEKQAAEEAKTTAENARDTAITERDAARESLRIAANCAVQNAVTAGRLTIADAESKLTEILAANDLEAAITDLGKLPPVVKTSSATGDLGNAKARIVIAANDEAAARKSEREQLVANEFEATNPSLSLGERKRIAWRRASAKNPALFGKKDSSGAAA